MQCSHARIFWDFYDWRRSEKVFAAISSGSNHKNGWTTMNEAYRNEFYYIASKQWNSLITFIIITFIYTAQIQLYSFQTCLTIKDLKIYPKKKTNIALNYNIISEKVFLKRWVFKLRLKT